MHIIVRILKWLIKAILWTVIVIIGIVIITGVTVRISRYVPSYKREMIMEERFGFSRYFSDLPDFKVTHYRSKKVHFGWRFGFLENKYLARHDYQRWHEYVLKFKEPLNQEMLDKMDSLVAVDDRHCISGWRCDSLNQEYFYFFDDIAKDVSDSIFFSKDGKKARYITVY